MRFCYVQEILSHDSHSNFRRKMCNCLLVQCHSCPIWPLVLRINLTNTPNKQSPYLRKILYRYLVDDSHIHKTNLYSKSNIFWNITPCCPLKVNRRFGRTYRLCCRAAWHLRSRCFLAQLILRPWGWRRYVRTKRRLTFNGLHGVISQKIVLFITTAVRTSNPTNVYSSAGSLQSDILYSHWNELHTSVVLLLLISFVIGYKGTSRIHFETCRLCCEELFPPLSQEHHPLAVCSLLLMYFILS
jgi:hypothetical protein